MNATTTQCKFCGNKKAVVIPVSQLPDLQAPEAGLEPATL